MGAAGFLRVAEPAAPGEPPRLSVHSVIVCVERGDGKIVTADPRWLARDDVRKQGAEVANAALDGELAKLVAVAEPAVAAEPETATVEPKAATEPAAEMVEPAVAAEPAPAVTEPVLAVAEPVRAMRERAAEAAVDPLDSHRRFLGDRRAALITASRRLRRRAWTSGT